ncbi:SO2930 family diheme c-type cytochrome [Marinobacter sp. chi1]|uniref:SO2930 family diheme c-type cytochrome n=1 Tax=Marinobacter suaedae TaxID=3057675 RepID=A0ABT8W076_9GAMM|nr:SO2930 family diheme c-type cytochrome [Marinobacter sp. chi1]MDO3721620.1 SO2930 family diheme c-type cytochrome [Marinobacter sp. chi1]
MAVTKPGTPAPHPAVSNFGFFLSIEQALPGSSSGNAPVELLMQFKTFSRTSLGLVIAALLTACGGGGGGGSTDTGGNAGNGGTQSACESTDGAINQKALASENCASLSSYRLFADSSNPTTNPNGTGIPFDLNTPLFTDYATKYRFVFVPEGEQAQYSKNEAFDFPVGTVISKTFSLPADTGVRGFDNETLIETRLLIHREAGWVALPYIWNAAGTEATLAVAGGASKRTIVHNGNQFDFTYRVPDANQCKQCHQYKAVSGGSVSQITPIGPKARSLNGNFDYALGTLNQLTYWEDAGILAGLPVDLNSVPKIPAYHDGDEQGLYSKSEAELLDLAKGYLDTNCAHCHRPEGGASNTGLKLEYWRDFESDRYAHGVCKKPVTYGGGALSFDVVPGDANQSIMHFRMNANTPLDKMPMLGRDLVHAEGVALIAAWINSLTGSCTL